MLALMLALSLHAEPAGDPAAPSPGRMSYSHALMVEEASTAFTVFERLSLTPRPGGYIALYREGRPDGAVWVLRASVSAWEPGESLVTTWTDSADLSDEEAGMFVSGVTGDLISAVRSTPAYPEQSICVDGAFLHAVIKLNGGDPVTGRRHSCLGGTAIDAYASALKGLAAEHLSIASQLDHLDIHTSP